MANADLTDQIALASNETAVPIDQNIGGAPISSTIAAVRIPGTFSLDVVDSLNFLEAGLGEVRDLVIKLRETDRSTGEFVQLVHKAHLEVPCDFNKFISFNGSDANQDDAYQFTGITLTNDPDVESDASKRLADSEFVLNLRPALEANEGAPLTGDSVKASYANSILSSVHFPVGAVIIDLATHLAGVEAANKDVKVTGTGTDATYQVKADKTKIGMTLFGKLKVDCSNVSGSPSLSAEASFQPSGTILGGGQHASITLTLLNQEDFTKAQDVVVELGAGTTGSLTGLSVSVGDPSSTSPDDFDITISLDDLGEADDTGSIGHSMISAIQASVDNSNSSGSNKLLEKFTIAVTQIDFQTDSDLSGFLRNLALDNDRLQAMPIKAGEKFIVQNPASISLQVRPFEYSFTNGGYSNVAAFNLIDNMEVYAVLKHAPANTAPVMQTAGKALLTV